MRLLLRNNAHRRREDGWEVAAAPDTPDRERWQWALRLIAPHAAPAAPKPSSERQTVNLPGHNGTAFTLQFDCDPNRVAAKTEAMIVGTPTRLERNSHDLTVLVIGQGQARLEGRHVLNALDAMVLEGDDPLTLEVERAGNEPTSLGVARIRSAVGQPINWIP